MHHTLIHHKAWNNSSEALSLIFKIGILPTIMWFTMPIASFLHGTGLTGRGSAAYFSVAVNSLADGNPVSRKDYTRAICFSPAADAVAYGNAVPCQDDAVDLGIPSHVLLWCRVRRELDGGKIGRGRGPGG